MYTAVISTAFNEEAKIVFCENFHRDRHAINSVLKFILHEDLISQSEYVQMMEEKEHEYKQIETVRKMNRNEFMKMFYEEFYTTSCRDAYNLEVMCREYSKNYACGKWEFSIRYSEINEKEIDDEDDEEDDE